MATERGTNRQTEANAQTEAAIFRGIKTEDLQLPVQRDIFVSFEFTRELGQSCNYSITARFYTARIELSRIGFDCITVCTPVFYTFVSNEYDEWKAQEQIG